MTRLHFEDEAELFAHKAWKTLKLELPVDLEKVARRLGIEVHEREFAEEIDGLYLRMEGVSPVIAVNTSYRKPPVRRRFTLAHEIGHHLLANRVASSGRHFFFDSAKTRQSIMERACDRFAALLLMPEDLVNHHFEELRYNPARRVGIMAQRFGVSAWAMRRRLRELSLVSRPRRR